MGFFDKERLIRAAGILGEKAGKAYEKAFDKTINAAQTTDQVVSSFMTEFQNQSSNRPAVVSEPEPAKDAYREVTVIPPVRSAKDQYVISFCKWKNCSLDRLPTGDFCGLHQREDDQFKARQCGNKRQHLSYEDAQLHAANLARKTGDNLAAYKCRVCNFFHTGHSNL